MLCVLISVCVAAASYQELNAQTPPHQRDTHSYKIELKIDFDRLTYTGVERVRWVNRGEKPSSIIYFHLYPNLQTLTNHGSTFSKFAPAPTIHNSFHHSTIRALRCA